MRDEAHVRLVDAHAERDRGDDHDAVLVEETVLMPGAHAGIEPGMIGQRGNAGFAERRRDVFDLGARQAIDHAGVAGMAFPDEVLQLRGGILLVDDLVADVGPVEACDELRRVGE